MRRWSKDWWWYFWKRVDYRTKSIIQYRLRLYKFKHMPYLYKSVVITPEHPRYHDAEWLMKQDREPKIVMGVKYEFRLIPHWVYDPAVRARNTPTLKSGELPKFRGVRRKDGSIAHEGFVPSSGYKSSKKRKRKKKAKS